MGSKRGIATRPAGDIYDRIATVAGVSREAVEQACEVMRTTAGLSVQTYADERLVLRALYALGLLPPAEDEQPNELWDVPGA